MMPMMPLMLTLSLLLLMVSLVVRLLSPAVCARHPTWQTVRDASFVPTPANSNGTLVAQMVP